MAITYGSLHIGDVRAEAVSAVPGVGVSRLQFTLAWSLHPIRVDKYTIFGTYIHVSVAPRGITSALFLGRAMPETAWTDESRSGAPFTQHVMYHLPLHADQFLALEHIRQGQGLAFTLDLRGNSHGPQGIRPIDASLQLRVAVSEWASVLRDANASDILLVGVALPLTTKKRKLVTAIALVRRAHEFQLRGEYAAAIGECRRAIESVWKIGKLEEAARAARKMLSDNTLARRSMSKKDRELALGEALINFTHPAHHVECSGDAEIFSRQDAALAVATAAALVSSVANSI